MAEKPIHELEEEWEKLSEAYFYQKEHLEGVKKRMDDLQAEINKRKGLIHESEC